MMATASTPCVKSNRCSPALAARKRTIGSEAAHVLNRLSPPKFIGSQAVCLVTKSCRGMVCREVMLGVRPKR